MRFAAPSSILTPLVLVPLMCLQLTACEKGRSGTRTPTQTALLEALEHYRDTDTFRVARDTTLDKYHGKSIPDSKAPTMKIQTLNLNLGTPAPTVRILARIKSDGDYPLLGVEKGTNLVWVSLSDQSHWVTPERDGAPDFPILRDPDLDRKAMPNHAPGLLKVKVNSDAFVLCLDDCPSGHCIYY